MAAHLAAPRNPPPPVLSVIEFDFLRKRRGFEVVQVLSWTQFSEMVASIEQEMLMEAQSGAPPPPVPTLHLSRARLPTLGTDQDSGPSPTIKIHVSSKSPQPPSTQSRMRQLVLDE